MGSGLTMESAAALLQHQPLLPDYQPLSEHHEFNDQYGAHAHASHHQAYTSSGAVDHQLRRDASAPVQPPAPYAFTATNNTSGRYQVSSERGIASETGSYPASSNFTDSSGGSISTSPSSAASSLQAYTSFHPNHCSSNFAVYPGAVQQPQSFVSSPYGTSSRPPPILDSTGSGMLPPPLHPIRSPISTSSHATDREAYPNSASFVARSHLSPGSQGTFGSYPTDTPRNAFAIPGLSSSNPSYPNSHSPMAAPGYPPSDCANFPWPTLEIHAEMSCDGQAVTPEVHAKVEKGFFPSSVDGKWTCYRRNYFSVQCNFELHPSITNGRMCLKRSGSTTTEFIQAMGMRLSAAVDGSAGKNIELVQHTPKRDAGPKNKIEVVKVSPSASGRSDHTVSSHGVYAMGMPAYHATGSYAGPLLPLQGTSEGGSSSSSSAQSSHLSSAYPYSTAQTQSPHMPIPGNNTQHVFERVQFKQATANNGKRRASQQYFHLIVELFADVRKEGSDTANWVKVAHRVSEKIVVRGRSPSHYHNEGQNGHGGRTGSTGGSSGGYSATGGASYASMGSTPFRGSGSAYGGGLANSGSYRTTAYGFQPQSDHSGSSASSVDGGAADADYPNDTAMSDAERSSIQDHAAYRYYPAPIYEAVPQAGLPLPKIESAARYSTDPSSWAVKHEYGEAVPGAQWPVSGLSRFQGVESSRGYFPTELGSSHYS